MTFKNGMRPIHPGEILREDFLLPLDLGVSALAKALRVPRSRLAGIIDEQRPVTADTALRLARYFDSDAQFWLGLQMTHDLRLAEIASAKQIDDEVSPRGTTPPVSANPTPRRSRPHRKSRH